MSGYQTVVSSLPVFHSCNVVAKNGCLGRSKRVDVDEAGRKFPCFAFAMLFVASMFFFTFDVLPFFGFHLVSLVFLHLFCFLLFFLDLRQIVSLPIYPT